MNNIKKSFILSFIFISTFLLFNLSYAQLGEVAGQPHFNVSLGSSQTLKVTLINEGITPTSFKVILPTLNQIVNTTTPTISAYPMNGTIAPNSDFSVNVTVYMPYNKNKPGLTWDGVLQFIEVQNTTTSSGVGAQVVAGIAKILTITAAPPKSDIFGLILPLIIILIIIMMAIYYILKSKKKHEKRLKESKPSSTRQESANTKKSSTNTKKVSKFSSTSRLKSKNTKVNKKPKKSTKRTKSKKRQTTKKNQRK
ncbi:MAG: hypothetical protein ACP5M9_03245 [Candidatus Micrarchaeia archaeon]